MSNTQKNPSINHHPLAGYYPDPNRIKKLNHLADNITELVAHLDAGTFQLLQLICEFDKEEGWEGTGIRSCAHWLNWKCGMSLGSARERVRVARALPKLPEISAAFCNGKVSHSKVRAMTRVATPKNEAALLQVALHGTASHVETQVRLYRKTKRIEALEEENLRHGHRELSWYIDIEDRGHVPAETCRRLACDCAKIHWHDNSQGEPLNIGRKTRSIPPAIRRALKRRDQGCCFPGCTCSRYVDAHHIQHWADGGETCMDNLVLLCRTHHRLVHEAGYGVRFEAGEGAVFCLPGGKVIPQGPDMRSRGNVFAITSGNHKNGLNITPGTAVPQWHGEQMDYGVAVDMLLQCE